MIRNGQCMSGAVVYRVTDPVGSVVAGHCTQCRTWSGHIRAAVPVPIDQFRMVQQRGLGWFNATPRAQRGFCHDCGASLFWQEEPGVMFVFAGSLDSRTGLQLTSGIFTADAGDYHGMADATPDRVPAERLDCGCLCGTVRFSVPGPAGEVTACHCSQCRRLSGHFAASFDVDEKDVEYEMHGGLATHGASGGGTRGFCRHCGSKLWFRARNGGFSVEAGSVKGPTGGHLTSHIHVADKGDYYPLDDGLPQWDGSGASLRETTAMFRCSVLWPFWSGRSRRAWRRGLACRAVQHDHDRLCGRQGGIGAADVGSEPGGSRALCCAGVAADAGLTKGERNGGYHLARWRHGAGTAGPDG